MTEIDANRISAEQQKQRATEVRAALTTEEGRRFVARRLAPMFEQIVLTGSAIQVAARIGRFNEALQLYLEIERIAPHELAKLLTERIDERRRKRQH